MSSNATLQIGSWVHCTLHGGKDGVIYAIHGEQNPASCQTIGRGVVVTGGGADFDIVWEDATESRMIPECLVRGSVQWKILNQPRATAEEIAAMRGAAILETNRKADEATAKAEKFAAAVKALRADHRYSYLKQTEAGKYASVALASGNMKKELQRAFPGTKFSVRSDSYTGGDSIDVSWTDGPTSKQVEAIADKYSGGYFDGMEDLYHDVHSPWTAVFGDAKHIFCHRRYSVEAMKEAVREVCLEYGYELAPVVEEYGGAAIPWNEKLGDQGGDGNATSIWTLRNLAHKWLQREHPFEERKEPERATAETGQPQPGDPEYEALKARLEQLQGKKGAA